LGGAASPATITAPPPGADATFAFSSAAAIGAASRPGRARTLLLLLGSHDLTCSTGHQALRLLSTTTTTGSSSTGVRDSDGRARTARWVGVGGSIGPRRDGKRTSRGDGGGGGFVGFLWPCVGCGGGAAFAFWSSSGVIGTRVVCAL
jgi:hypothetical protein